MQPAEAEGLMRLLVAHWPRWERASATAFLDQLVERHERIAVPAIQECINTLERPPTWSQFKALYDKEARRTAQDSEACAICGGSSWEFINENTVRQCRCRIKP